MFKFMSTRWIGRSVMVLAAVFSSAALIFGVTAAGGCGPNDAIIIRCIDDAAPDGYDSAADIDAGRVPFCE